MTIEDTTDKEAESTEAEEVGSEDATADTEEVNGTTAAVTFNPEELLRQNDIFVWKPKWKLPTDLKELNKDIPKPKIIKVSTTGSLDISFSDRRFIEETDSLIDDLN